MQCPLRTDSCSSTYGRRPHLPHGELVAVSDEHRPYALRMEPTGRLELTWTNKHLRLITTETGGYEWVEPHDPRVTEVRLIEDISTVGEVSLDPEGTDNLLIEGDALHALSALNRIPALARRYSGQVRLVYIDPPFNTGQAFDHYDDNLEHSVWLSMLRDRLEQIQPLLAPNGSVWVHLDDAEVHRCRCVMDEILGASNFVATVQWQRRYAPRNTAPFISTDHDSLLVYARDLRSLRFGLLPRTETMNAAYSNPDSDPRGPWRRDNLTARNPYAAGVYPVTTPSGRVVDGPPHGTYWRVSAPKLRELDEDGRIYWGKNHDSNPYLKRFLSEVKDGRVAGSVWSPDEVGYTRNGKEDLRAAIGPTAKPFSTPKPEKLLARIMGLATDPGDLALDCFVGSGTTAAVAHKMGRRWVGVEREPSTIEEFTRPRLERVVAGEDPGGITSTVDWKGGGGFRHVKIGPSMFDLDSETGEVFLAEWATNGAFSDAVAAQLGFEKEDEPPFCGRKGRTRLAVLDGVVGAAEMEFLVASLGERERALVVGKAFTEDAEGRLREQSPGSRVRHAPHDLLQRGGRP